LQLRRHRQRNRRRERNGRDRLRCDRRLVERWLVRQRRNRRYGCHRREWRLEIPFYVTGDVASNGPSIIGFQFHHNGGTGSPPFAFGLNDGSLRFSIEEAPTGPNQHTNFFPLQENTLVDLVVEVKFGYVADGAYIRLWANGTKYVDITDKNIGYPDLESTAGYWKYCSLYDWSNLVNGSRSVHCGPVVKFLKRP
jgi:Polysaccharide lyase